MAASTLAKYRSIMLTQFAPPGGWSRNLFTQTLLLSAFALCLFTLVAQAHEEFKVLVFSKTAGFRHDSIANGIEAIRTLGTNNEFTVDASEDAAIFSDANLSNYQAVVFLTTTGDVLDTTQQDAFERYIQAGGG